MYNKTLKNYKEIYNKINNLYETENYSITKACKTLEISRGLYYNICKILEKTSIVNSDKILQEGGNQELNFNIESEELLKTDISTDTIDNIIEKVDKTINKIKKKKIIINNIENNIYSKINKDDVKQYENNGKRDQKFYENTYLGK